MKISVNSIGDSFGHCLLERGIRHLKIIILIGHKPHFHDRDRNGTPVNACHGVSVDNATVLKTGGCTVGIDNTL